MTDNLACKDYRTIIKHEMAQFLASPVRVTSTFCGIELEKSVVNNLSRLCKRFFTHPYSPVDPWGCGNPLRLRSGLSGFRKGKRSVRHISEPNPRALNSISYTCR